MLTTYTLCVYYKANRMNAYIDFKDKSLAEKVAKIVRQDMLVDFTDIVAFDE